MRWLRTLWRPTLVRRLVGALMLAFALVGAVLVAVDYLEFRRAMTSHPGIRSVADALLATLEPIGDAHDAALIVAASARQLNLLRRESGALPGEVLFELRAADGRRVQASPALGAARPEVAAGEVSVLEIGGRPHWVVQAARGPWQLVVAEPHLSDAAALGLIGDGLLGSLLLAFPLVLVPLWIAVARGLRPLRELARRVSERAAHDLSPLGIAPRHDELRPLVTAFDQLLARLREHVQRERSFVHDAAHELRTPMAAIATQAHVLAHAPDADDRARAGAALEQALQRSAHLSRQLLDLAALADAHPRPPQALDLAALVQQLLARAADRAEAAGLELSLEAPDQLPCRLDRVAFESVLQNLLDNALRYVPAGGRVAVELRVADGVSTLTVADDGPGIAPADRERVFERFWRGEAQAHVSGSGLGLAIVRQAALRLGGQVRLEGGLGGRGVAFVLTLPLAT